MEKRLAAQFHKLVFDRLEQITEEEENNKKFSYKWDVKR